MTTETPFINCDIISVHSVSHTDDYFYLIHKGYHYNSLESGIIVFEQDCIQIPIYEIQDINLLNNLDYEFISKFRIPIIQRVVETNTEFWKINLKYYEDYKLQPSNI